jgi:hypothetical protein
VHASGGIRTPQSRQASGRRPALPPGLTSRTKVFCLIVLVGLYSVAIKINVIIEVIVADFTIMCVRECRLPIYFLLSRGDVHANAKQIMLQFGVSRYGYTKYMNQ